MTWLDSLWAAFKRFAQVSAWVGGAMLLVAALVVTVEIVLRKMVSPVFGPQYNITGSDEIAAYLFAVGTSLSLAHVVTTRGNVRIDILYLGLGPRTRALLDLASLAIFMLFVAVLLERTWSVATMSYVDQIRSNTTLRVPLAWAQIPWVIGLSIFGFALALAFLATLAHVVRGRWVAAAAISGAASTEEEVSAELEGLGYKRANAGAGREGNH